MSTLRPSLVSGILGALVCASLSACSGQSSSTTPRPPPLVHHAGLGGGAGLHVVLSPGLAAPR